MSKIKVWLLANYPADGQESMQRYARLLQELFDGDPFIEIQGHTPSVILGNKIDHSFWKKWAGYWDKFVVFPRRIRRLWEQTPDKNRPDWIHVADHSNAPWLAHLKGMPVVITCHDIFAIESALGGIPQNPTRWSGKLLQKWIARHLRGAKYLISVSEYTAKQLEIRFPTAGSKALEIIHSALNTDYSAITDLPSDECLSRFCLPGTEVPLLFSISNNSWYKNRSGLVDIFEMVCDLAEAVGRTLPMLIIGGKWPTLELQERMIHSRRSERIQFTGPLTNAELAAFYHRADLFVYPSLVEGFGWPPLEAQSSGCPVISGYGGALAETLQESAVLCDPHDIEKFAEQICRLLDDRSLRDALVKKGYDNMRRFSRDKMAENYRAFYVKHLPAKKEKVI